MKEKSTLSFSLQIYEHIQSWIILTVVIYTQQVFMRTVAHGKKLFLFQEVLVLMDLKTSARVKRQAVHDGIGGAGYDHDGMEGCV